MAEQVSGQADRPQPVAKPTRSTITLVAVGLIVIVSVAAAFAFRPIFTAYQIRTAGILIDRVSQIALTTAGPEPLACDLAIPQASRVGNLLESAQDHLQAAERFDRKNSQIVLLMGEAQCLSGNYSQAAADFQRYISLRPANPIGKLELAAALDRQCPPALSSGYLIVCPDAQLHSQVLDQFTSAGVTPDQMAASAEAEFGLGHYEQAVLWYWRSLPTRPTTDHSLLFRWAIASVMTSHQVPEAAVYNGFPLYAVKPAMQINGGDLVWMITSSTYHVQYGDPLAQFSPQGSTAGVMWWKGRSGVFINIPAPGRYMLTVHVQDTPPGPLHVGIEMDLSPIKQFTLNQGNESWNDLSAQVELSAGVHLLSINFLEDTGDLHLGWIQINPVP